jgi:hypothetical protein
MMLDYESLYILYSITRQNQIFLSKLSSENRYKKTNWSALNDQLAFFLRWICRYVGKYNQGYLLSAIFTFMIVLLPKMPHLMREDSSSRYVAISSIVDCLVIFPIIIPSYAYASMVSASFPLSVMSSFLESRQDTLIAVSLLMGWKLYAHHP